MLVLLNNQEEYWYTCPQCGSSYYRFYDFTDPFKKWTCSACGYPDVIWDWQPYRQYTSTYLGYTDFKFDTFTEVGEWEHISIS